MELQYPSFPILFTLFLFVSFLAKIVKKSNTHLPPGPWKLPLIGNLHQLASSLPHHAMRDLAKKHGPLMSLQLGGLLSIVVSSAEMAKEVMKTHDVIFPSRAHIIATRIMSYNSTNLAHSLYGPYWRQLRKICVSVLLTPKRVLSFQSIRQEEVSNLVRFIGSNAGSPLNLTHEIFSLAFGITSRAAFGRRFIDQEKFIAIVEESLKAKWNLLMSPICILVLNGFITSLECGPNSEKFHKEADRIMENMVQEHISHKTADSTGKEEKEEDLVDALLEYHDCGPNEFSLTTNNIKALILDIFAAGSETTASTIDWAMTEMVKNPRIMKHAQAEVRQVFGGKRNVDETDIEELKYLKLVVKETLRLHPAVPFLLPRECQERCVINGYEILEKTKVFVNVWAIARDPEVWKDPESFIPERFLDCSVDFKGNHFEYIPFGAGRRICPSMNFGLTNVEFELAQLLFHFDWKLPDGMKEKDMDMTEDFGMTVKRKQQLKVIPVPYKNSTI